MAAGKLVRHMSLTHRRPDAFPNDSPTQSDANVALRKTTQKKINFVVFSLIHPNAFTNWPPLERLLHSSLAALCETNHDSNRLRAFDLDFPTFILPASSGSKSVSRFKAT